MQSRKPSTEKAPSATDERRRKFLKTALAGTFAAPVVTSLAVDHLMNTARAQQAYVAPTVTAFERLAPLPGAGAHPEATYRVTFSQPIDTASFPCWLLTSYDQTGCASGGGSAIGSRSGSQYNPAYLIWGDGNTALIIRMVDETGGGQHTDASGSVSFGVNDGPCPNQLLGANGLAVVAGTWCVSYTQIED